MSFAGRVEVAEGRGLHVHDAGGAGLPVLLLHGFTGSGESMEAAARALPLGARTISVDLLGHGRSDAPAEAKEYAMETAVRDLVAVLDARRIERCVVLGYSMGARLALGVAVFAPERVRAVVAIGARAGIADAGLREARVTDDEALAAAIRSRGIEWFVDHWMSLPIFASQKRLGAEALSEARRQRLSNVVDGLAGSLCGMGAGAQPVLFEALPLVAAPTLLVTGSEDERFGASARDLQKRLPLGHCEVIPEAGHAAHLENPDAFAHAVRGFLADLESDPAPEVRPGSARAWLAAARPATLPASVVPVAVGSAVAFSEGMGSFAGVAVCLLAAVALQLATNFVNDYADFERGTDGADRLGPPRAAQQGWLTPRALRAGAVGALAVAAAAGGVGIAWGGWPIAAAGALALFCAWAYTGGPYPLGYHGLGDILVFAFFGLFAVVGTHWVQAHQLSPAAWASAVPIGFLATALIAVNNLRDRPTDVEAGKRTMAVRLGAAGARRYTAGLIGLAFAALAVVAAAGAGAFAALPLLTLPLALPVMRSVARDEGPALNATLAATGRLEVAFGVMLVATWCAVAWPY